MFIKKLLLPFVILTISSVSMLAQSKSDPGLKLITNEKYTEAKQHFTSLLNTDSKSEAYFYLGQIYFLEEKYDSAKASYLNGIQADDDNALNYAGMVKVSAAQKNTTDAEKYEKQAIDAEDDNAKVYVVLSEAYNNPMNKNSDKAMDLLNKALKLDPKNVQAHIDIGNLFLEKGNGTDAIKHFQEAINIDPSNPEALTLKARIYTLINNYDDAIALLKEAIKNDPSYPHAYNELAEVYANQKNYTQAAEYYAKYMEVSEVTLEKQRRYASILYLNKDYQKAIDVLQDVLKKQPDNASAIRVIAYSYLRLEDIQNSKEYFQKLFSIPNADFMPGDYENYAILLGKTHDDSLAIVYMEKVVQMDSTRKDILGQISILQYQHKNWPGVISALNRKGNLTGQELFDLGKAYYFAKDTVMADTTFGRLIAAKPDLAIAYDWKARIKSMQDSSSELGLAKPYYEQFIVLSKDDTTKYKRELIEAYSYLGYYYYIKDDKSTSLTNWEKVAAIDPENEQAKAAIEQLKKKSRP